MKSFEAFVTVILLIFLVPPLSISLVLDTITQNRPIHDGDVLLSDQKTFALGFFSPAKSRFRYAGIWYNKVPQQTVVWVANRDNPINDTSGVLAINSHGRLIIYAKNQNSALWSANVSVSSEESSSASVAKLLDIGNLVLLQNNSTGRSYVRWQSFDYPTNTYLPLMKLGLNRKSGLDRFITSWKSADNPGTGNCTYRMDLTGYPQMLAYKNRVPFWRAGWTGPRWSGVPTMINRFVYNASFVNNQDEISITYAIINNSDSVFLRFVIEESGTMQQFMWHDQRQEWVEFWYAPNDLCDNYGRCGGNGNCDLSDVSRFECVCLPGFEPRSRTSWDLRDTSGGCKRMRAGSHMCGDGEGFLKVTRVKLPDTSNARVEMGLNLRECKEKCLKDCNCTAYTSVDETTDGVGCLSWHGDLVDIKTYTDTGMDLYIRVDETTLVKVRKSKDLFGDTLGLKYMEEAGLDDSTNDSDVPLFDLHTIVVATSNFSLDNKLGQGGFGSVYKGMLSNGKEIAVKRLSKCSGQGNEEFKNEVMLIAKLQHRNLVRILGCCFEEKEKMIVYEYLPNKSLDCLIFDEEKRKLLDWRKRFDIIYGVARGMFGYMSPEYAMEGRFSIKSDVYSFGILLLEIITGKKNVTYYRENTDTNLVGHVWELWREGKASEIVDSCVDESFVGDALRCIKVGLLCVQEFAADRPHMSAVVFMLSNDSALPTPKQPAFVFKRSTYTITSEGANSINDVTCSGVEAR
ncbi:hypothetical protein TIFTF001_018881 [Ficus carica]|uniref:Receptor-like serine/threonine-protein kinase n=1 Tax=Ficus carica TaxID=3494 RepID=A0AA88ABX6_FICCA|nr:hypothetical protein TIFTF001_018881 [Ficus carica]